MRLLLSGLVVLLVGLLRGWQDWLIRLGLGLGLLDPADATTVDVVGKLADEDAGTTKRAALLPLAATSPFKAVVNAIRDSDVVGSLDMDVE